MYISRDLDSYNSMYHKTHTVHSQDPKYVPWSLCQSPRRGRLLEEARYFTQFFNNKHKVGRELTSPDLTCLAYNMSYLAHDWLSVPVPLLSIDVQAFMNAGLDITWDSCLVVQLSVWGDVFVLAGCTLSFLSPTVPPGKAQFSRLYDTSLAVLHLSEWEPWVTARPLRWTFYVLSRHVVFSSGGRPHFFNSQNLSLSHLFSSSK